MKTTTRSHQNLYWNLYIKGWELASCVYAFSGIADSRGSRDAQTESELRALIRQMTTHPEASDRRPGLFHFEAAQADAPSPLQWGA